MRLRSWLGTLVLTALLSAGSVQAARRPDADVVRLEAELLQIESDPALAQAADLERLLAHQAIEALAKARSKDRPSALWIAQMRVETARLAAQLAPLTEQARTLDRERDAILVEASRRDAENARREAERQRLQAVAREEEAERAAQASGRLQEQAAAQTEAANQEAAQARKLAEARELEAELARKEAELAAKFFGKSEQSAPVSLLDRKSVAGKVVFVLAGDAFATGKAVLNPAAREALAKLATELKRRKAKVSISGFTDSQGSESANQVLSLQRAQAVRTALLRGGMSASRLQARGRGERNPVADNKTEAGRARNRRVEIVVE